MVLGAQLARHRPEDTGADRLGLVVDQNRSVAVETDHRTIGTADILADPDHDGLHGVALLSLAAGDRVLDRHNDNVAHGGIATLGTSKHLDAHDTACA